MPEKYGDWHVINVRYNRWVENGTIQKLFTELAKADLVDIAGLYAMIDSRTAKVHPDGCGALKKMANSLLAGRQEETVPKFT